MIASSLFLVTFKGEPASVSLISTGVLFYLTPVAVSGYFLLPEKTWEKRQWLFLPTISGLIAFAFLGNYFAFAATPIYMPINMTAVLDANQLHVDTGFHTSLIQSFIRKGYTSTSFHLDTPIFYHAATHYIDSLFFRLSNVDPLTNYGFIHALKAISILIAVFALSLRMGAANSKSAIVLIFILNSIFIIGSWHTIISHSQYLAVLLIILLWPWLRRLVDQPVNSLQLLAFYVLCVILLYAKISHGLTIIGVIGLAIFFKNPRNISVWILGFGLAATLVAFAYLMSSGGQRSANFDFDLTAMREQLVGGILVILILITGLIKSPRYFSPLLAPLAIIYVAYSAFLYPFVTQGSGDLFYFGIAFVLVAWLALCELIWVVLFSLNPYSLIRSFQPLRLGFIVLILICLNDWAPRAFYIDSYLKKWARAGFPFNTINNVALDNKIVNWRDLRTKTAETFKNTQLAEPNKQVVLFIPAKMQRELGTQLGQRYTEAWSQHLVLTAILGYPQIHGMPPNEIKGYGYTDYPKTALWRDIPDPTFCSNEFAILTLRELSPVSFERYTCKDS